MIDIILTYPIPTRESPAGKPALSIFMVGAALENRGFNVEYFDERFDPFSRLEELLLQRPVCVGVSSMTGYQLVGAGRILKAVKEAGAGIFTVLGGVHATILPRECIENGNVDFVVVGEGELTLSELVGSLKVGKGPSGVKGVFWKDGDRVVENGPRSPVPPSQWPFPMTRKSKRYFQTASDEGEIMYQTTRGCPFSCRFCYNNVFNNRKWRAAPLEKVKSELTRFKEELGCGKLLLCDDNVGADRKRLIRLSEILKEMNIRWYSSIRADSVDTDLLRTLEKNNCMHLLIGVESGSETILKDVIGKGHGVDAIRKCADAFSRTGLRGRYNFVYGLPGDDMKSLRMSMDLTDRILKTDGNAIIAFDSYAPYPGTELFRKAVDGGFKPPRGLMEWSRITLSNPLNPVAEAIYFIIGLKTRGAKGDITSRNFPGIRRLLILPFEISARIRWRLRFLRFYGFEKAAIRRLLEVAHRRRMPAA